MYLSITVYLISFLFAFSRGISELAFVIFNQVDDFHRYLALNLKENLEIQSRQLNLDVPQIFISEQFRIEADWTLFPIITKLDRILNESGIEWVIFLEDRSNVSVKALKNIIKNYNSTKELILGHALYDVVPSIIHHFAFYDGQSIFYYPNMGSGIIFTYSLLKGISDRIKRNDLLKNVDFHVDPAYEFALFIYNKGKGPMVLHEPNLCTSEESHCAIYPKAFIPCNKPDPSTIYFAVKTCKKYHNLRMSVVKTTWSRYTKKVTFFSDSLDKDIPTVYLDTVHTEKGHCMKSIASLHYVKEKIKDDKDVKWVALVDDDTILSVSRLSELVTCYDPTKHLILGERYRFGSKGIVGFDYPTGGAGLLISLTALDNLIQYCHCPDPESPDDMVIGACAQTHGITLVHVPQMHQARPEDYPQGRLANRDAMTFHKHWMIDPGKLYRELFEEEDRQLSRDALKKDEL